MPENAVLYEVKDHIARITLARPVIDMELSQSLQEACGAVNGSDDVCVVVLDSAGDAFCTGGEKGAEAAAAAVAAIEKPVIAAVNGDALDLGLELALSADIRIAAANARFGMTQVAGGRVPAGGGTQRLPRIIGRGKALELIMTAAVIGAAAGLEIGLVSKVVPVAELSAESWKLAQTIAAKGPIALRYLKEAVIKGMDMTLEQGLRLEADLYFLLHTTADRTEGIKSYLEKRPPEYRGK